MTRAEFFALTPAEALRLFEAGEITDELLEEHQAYWESLKPAETEQ